MCNKHRRFSSYTDRVSWSWEEALEIATNRVVKRGCRQRIVRHFGRFSPKGIWYIQDA